MTNEDLKSIVRRLDSIEADCRMVEIKIKTIKNAIEAYLMMGARK